MKQERHKKNIKIKKSYKNKNGKIVPVKLNNWVKKDLIKKRELHMKCEKLSGKTN